MRFLKNKYAIVLLVLIIISTSIIYWKFYMIRTYVGVGTPTATACSLCGDPKGERSYVTYKKRGNDIIDVKFDTYLPGKGSKIEYSKSGDYKINEDPSGGGIAWDAHVSKLEDYIVKTDKFPKLDKEGHDVDGVSGATIRIVEFKNAFDSAKTEWDAKHSDEASVYKNLYKEKLEL